MIKALEQGVWINCSNSLNDKELISHAAFLTTRCEYRAVVCATKDKFEITQASYSIHRCPDMSKRREADIPELIGASVMRDRVKAIRNLKDFDDGGKVKELLTECIRGMIQSETYLTSELGYKTREEYEIFWRSDKAGYCRSYGDEMPPIDEWSIYIGAYEHIRVKNFYTKYKSYVILQENEDEAVISGTYNDSFHEMHSELTYNLASRNITAFDMAVIRAPHQACYELSHTAAESFIGKPIDSFSKRETGKIIGGSSGCFHLVDIVYDMVSAAMELPNGK